jgi:large subunit ribosomal protein L22
MEVIAKARYIRMSPKKVRLVADMVRGMDVDKAEAQLKFVKKAASRPVLKVIQSARANAEHNFKMSPETLFVKTIMVDGGPVLHRWIPRAFGRATPLRKRSSHITVVLDERTKEGAPEGIKAAVVKKEGQKDSGTEGQKKEKKAEKKEVVKKEEKQAEKKEEVKEEKKTEEKVEDEKSEKAPAAEAVEEKSEEDKKPEEEKGDDAKKNESAS